MIPGMVFSMLMQGIKANQENSDSNKLNNMSMGINPIDPTYKTSPYAQQRLGMAQNLLNARMPGATSMERNIQANTSNQMENVNRNATSGSQALAMGAAVQGQGNQAVQNLGTQEQQDYYNRSQNVVGAEQGMTGEGDKVYQDQLRDYQEKQGLKNAYLGAAMQNKQTALNSYANLGTSASSFMSMLPKKKPIPDAQADNSFMGMSPTNTSGGMDSNNYMPGQMDPSMMSNLGGMFMRQ